MNPQEAQLFVEEKTGVLVPILELILDHLDLNPEGIQLDPKTIQAIIDDLKTFQEIQATRKQDR